MKSLLTLLTFLLMLAAPRIAAADPAESGDVAGTRIAYFTNTRHVNATTPDRQNYVIIDEAIWEHSQADLADLRLYLGDREVPYAMTVQRGRGGVQEVPRRVLNLGRANGETQFVLDMTGLPEYNQVTLRLAESARNFVARARVEGLAEPNQREAVDLGTSTLFDFSREKLGANFSLSFQPATFRFLRITVPQIAPDQVLGATISDTRTRASDWTPISIQPRISQSGRTTVITWDAPPHVPVARLTVAVDPQQVNFRRPVQIQDAEGRIIATYDLSRIHLVRDGKPVDSECLALVFPEARSAQFKAIIQNGDDPPLSVTGVKAFAIERRIYFDPKGSTVLGLYYGDPKLSAPVYDYAKLFRADENASLATLGPDTRNAAYTGRPDERPWTERHPAVLWTALVLAVLGLGAIALRGLKGSSSPV